MLIGIPRVSFEIYVDVCIFCVWVERIRAEIVVRFFVDVIDRGGRETAAARKSQHTTPPNPSRTDLNIF